MSPDQKSYQKTIDVIHECLKAGFSPHGVKGPLGSAITEAARRFGVTPASIRSRLTTCSLRGLGVDWSRYKPPPKIDAATDTPFVQTEEFELSGLKDQIKALKAALTSQKRAELTYDAVKKHILEVYESPPSPPSWLSKPAKASKGLTGVPTLFCSDWHWGEVVKAHEVEGANEFNIEIAHARVKKLWQRAEQLLFEHISNPTYDGIVIPLGGDMITGDIHEELSRTNEMPVLPTVLDVIDVLVWLLTKAADRFGNVYVPCVTGNHGRTGFKIQYKERGPTSYDWLAYQTLKRHFVKDERLTFDIPDGPDVSYRIYNHRYLLTHGDQFRGGTGIAGPLMTIERGRHKKSTRNTAIGFPFDTMIIGHWHTLIQLQHLIVNGTAKGYDEFSFGNNFSFEKPCQALWITHPEHGITFQMPVYLDDDRKRSDSPWVSVTKRKP